MKSIVLCGNKTGTCLLFGWLFFHVGMNRPTRDFFFLAIQIFYLFQKKSRVLCGAENRDVALVSFTLFLSWGPKQLKGSSLLTFFFPFHAIQTPMLFRKNLMRSRVSWRTKDAEMMMLVSSGLFLPLNSMSILLYKSSHEVLSVDIFSSGGWGHELVDESASLTFYLSCDSHAHLFKKVPCEVNILGWSYEWAVDPCSGMHSFGWLTEFLPIFLE